MLLLCTALLALAPPAELATIAESSGYTCTATSAEVRALVARLDDWSDRIRVVEIGRSNDGQPLEMMIVAPGTPDPDPLRVLLIGNIHAGEVCGKEALLSLTRDLLHEGWEAPCELLVMPNFNPDGNDEMDEDNRPGQIGPSCGMGERPNAQGLDLNRDWVKLETPEVRAMVGVLTDYDPHLVVDTHTTNGSHHRMALTYAAPQNPSGFEPSIAFVRDDLLARVTDVVLERTGEQMFFYGNFNRAHDQWATYSAQPRFGGPYRGLRGQMSILSEAYAYIDYEARVKITEAFVRAILDEALASRTDIIALHRAARADTIARGRDPQPDDVIGVRHQLAAWPKPVSIPGWVMDESGNGRPTPTTEPCEHTVIHLGRFEPTRSVRRPHGYAIPAGNDALVAKLREHGVLVEVFDGPLTVETYRIDERTDARRAFQGHHVRSLEATARTGVLREPVTVITTAQPLGNLIVYLLEPESEDGLAAWGHVEATAGEDYPVHRIVAPWTSDTTR